MHNFKILNWITGKSGNSTNDWNVPTILVMAFTFIYLFFMVYEPVS